MLTRELAAPNDLEAFWMPYTSNRHFKANPRLIAGAEGMHYVMLDGRRLIDGSAGLWCCNAGHGHPEIVEAIREQAGTLDFAPSFQWGHPRAFELASRLADLFPATSTTPSSPTRAPSRSTPRSRSRSPTSARSARARAPA
jgi:beta-alanine--pyruvate transaminase